MSYEEKEEINLYGYLCMARLSQQRAAVEYLRSTTTARDLHILEEQAYWQIRHGTVADVALCAGSIYDAKTTMYELAKTWALSKLGEESI